MNANERKWGLQTRTTGRQGRGFAFIRVHSRLVSALCVAATGLGVCFVERPSRAEGESVSVVRVNDATTHRSEQGERFGVASLVLPNVRWDKAKAVERIEAYTRQAAALGAKIVVTPETCLDGYVCHQPGLTKEQFATLAEPVEGGPAIGRLRELARELDLYLCVGFTESDDGKLYNTALLIGPEGETVGKYRKTHGVEEMFIPGDELPVFETRYGKVGLMICYDRQPPEIARMLALRGAELILVPSNGMWERMNDAMLRSRAYENGVYLVFSHPRDGLVIDPGGRIIAANTTVPGQNVGLPTNTGTEDADGWPEAVVRQIDLAAWRGYNSTLSQRRPGLYGRIRE